MYPSEAIDWEDGRGRERVGLVSSISGGICGCGWVRKGV
jgi:hypothetical protein